MSILLKMLKFVNKTFIPKVNISPYHLRVQSQYNGNSAVRSPGRTTSSIDFEGAGFKPAQVC